VLYVFIYVMQLFQPYLTLYFYCQKFDKPVYNRKSENRDSHGMTAQLMIFWDVTACKEAEIYQCFGEHYCTQDSFHLPNFFIYFQREYN